MNFYRLPVISDYCRLIFVIRLRFYNKINPQYVGRSLGFFVALSFSKPAMDEIDRVKRDEQLIIIPLTAQQIIDEETKLNI